MSQSVAWQCIQAQTELAHLTNTLPPHDSYENLMSVIEPKLSTLHTESTSIYDCLLKRGVRLPTVQDAQGGNAPNTYSGARPPVVVFLCDIEGTTTPLPFVRDVMMPIAAAHVDAYTKAHFPSDTTFVQQVVAATSFVVATPIDHPVEASPVAPTTVAQTLSDAYAKSESAHFADENANEAVRQLFCHHFKEQLKNGSKEAYMKAVEAAIWAEVYAKGQHQTQVFPDVNEFFRYAGDRAMSNSTRIAIYSTGSVAAQHLLMQHTPYGDLNPFISAYFDPTTVGTKLAPKTYLRIRNLLLKQFEIMSSDSLQIVFLTDNTSEASAADSSGAVDCSVLCVRPLNAWIAADTLLSVSVPFITSFTQLMRPDEKVDYDQLVRDTMAALKDREP